MYVTSAILKGIKADATEIFMNKKKNIFLYAKKFHIWVIACQNDLCRGEFEDKIKF